MLSKTVVGVLVFVVVTFFLSTLASAATIYSTGNDGTDLIRIDTNTGTATLIGSSGYSDTYAAAFTPDGTLWTIVNGFTDGQLARFNLATGAATPVGTSWGTNDVIALEANSAGTLYAAGFDGSFYTVNTTNGQLTYVGDMGFTSIMDMAFDNSGTLWAVADSSTEPNTDLYTINPSTGAGTYVCTITGASWVMGIMVDHATGTMYVTNYEDPAYLYRFDPNTCTATQIGSGIGSITFPHGGDIMQIVTVPTMTEWGMIVFMLVAGTSAVYYLRRSRA